jgi:hypothetical protein
MLLRHPPCYLDIRHVSETPTMLLRHPSCYLYSQDVFETTVYTQTQIRHKSSHKELELMTNRASLLCGNRSEYHNTENLKNKMSNTNSTNKETSTCRKGMSLTSRLCQKLHICFLYVVEIFI